MEWDETQAVLKQSTMTVSPAWRGGGCPTSASNPQLERRIITLDHDLFALLKAPAGLEGPSLLVAVSLAQWAILLGPFVLTALWLAGSAEDRVAAVAAAAAATLALISAAVLSPLIDAPRPFVNGGAVNYLAHVRDGSFPSDHATLAFAIAGGLLLRRPPRARGVWLPLMAVAVAIGWARVYLGAHYPSDIVGGAVFGAAAVAITATPPGHAAIQTLNTIGEHVRARTLAGWRRFSHANPTPGAHDP